LHLAADAGAPGEILRRGSVIIRFLASKSLSFMLFGVPGLKRTLIRTLALVAVSISMISCGSSSSSNTGQGSSKLKFRVFVSNPLFPSGAGNGPVVNIVDAAKDALSLTTISLAGNSTQPGLMVVSPNREFTMIFSALGNSVTLINNSTEAIAQSSNGGSSTPVPSISLPGFTESMFIGNANTTAYAAVPGAPVAGQPPGAVEVLNLQAGSISASIPVPGAHFLVPSPDGNHILVFSDNSDTITVISTILIGTHTDPRSFITGFDRPVWSIFSDNATAYVLNCGPQCGGMAAGVSLLDGAYPAPKASIRFSGTTIPVSASTVGLVSGNTLYVAGTPPARGCGSGTEAPSCGELTMIDTTSKAVTGSAVITDGYHDRIQISQDGQLFIGARGCSNVNVSGGEVRGCLSIFNTQSPKVVIPPQIGDVTGIQPIAGRNVGYVVQNGSLGIYDTATDKLQVSPTNSLNNNGQVNIVGQLFDVKLVD
jgi:hypothetical protein